MKWKIGLLAINLALAGCDKSAEREAQARSDAEWALKNADRMAAQNVKLVADVKPGTASGTDAGRVCRAAVASLMEKDPAIIAVTSIDGAQADVSYQRPDDGKVWRARCAISGDRVSWATIHDGALGHWRSEDDIRYVLSGPAIKIAVRTDGVMTSVKTYKIG